MAEIIMEIFQEAKECNVERMGKSSSNLSFEELVEKLTIQTNNYPKDAQPQGRMGYLESLFGDF